MHAAKGINTYPLGDHLVLHDTKVEKLHLLNPMAQSIWQACDQGFQLSEIAHTLSELHQLPMDSALLTVRSTMETWRESDPADATQAATDTTRVARPPPARITRYYGYYDRAVRVNYSATKLESLIHPVFESMATPLVKHPDHVFDVYQEQNAFVLSRYLQ